MKPLGGLVAGILQASAAEDLYLIKCTINSMQIEFDPAKRHETLLHRGLDFADCQQAFAGVSFTFEDARKGYGEHRFITWALMQERLVVIVWTRAGKSGASFH